MLYGTSLSPALLLSLRVRQAALLCLNRHLPRVWDSWQTVLSGQNPLQTCKTNNSRVPPPCISGTGYIICGAQFKMKGQGLLLNMAAAEH